MKISKYLHSCLLIEENGKTILMDPGIFTYQEKALAIETLTNLDYITITHEHPDHMHIPFIKDLVTKFPNVQIITNPSAASMLEKEGITAQTVGNELINLEETPHEKLWDIPAPQNVLVKVFNKVTHPGDSHHFDTTTEFLALPIQAPWGSTNDAVALALTLKPKVIIPIHDWMWKDGFRQTMYQRLKDFFAKNNIDFKPLEMGEIIEV